ncbi:uncharacterized protein LAESUDRAFT_710649 [Laetiporus sulphureus 93-53]|uniref:Protein kinase domain-containing protein n=1 Tax=Laetiporus sulphureus 93-53 TaxID=1314785 RepID=A0A165HUV3_9APHY|nr:uncharacterized protein LAESUDRAFT_710649 [Laetiporus sulphureus 93-53]KZT12220.1 hypothetical protein LAESUDRAFT_710649 [Laetiporus sulphureus 93-53]
MPNLVNKQKLCKGEYTILRSGVEVILGCNPDLYHHGHPHVLHFTFVYYWVRPQLFFVTYYLGKVIGSGGFRMVYKAQHHVTDKYQAVKNSNPQEMLISQKAAAIHKKIRILVSLSHLCCVDIIMELVTVGDLLNLIDEQSLSSYKRAAFSPENFGLTKYSAETILDVKCRRLFN